MRIICIDIFYRDSAMFGSIRHFISSIYYGSYISTSMSKYHVEDLSSRD